MPRGPLKARVRSSVLRTCAARWLRIASLSVGALLGGCRTELPPVLIWGCAVLRADGSCEQDRLDPRDLVLFVEVSPSTRVTSDSTQSLRTAPTEGGLLITVRPKTDAQELVLYLSTFWHRYQYRLRLHSDSEVPWIREARRIERSKQLPKDPTRPARAASLLLKNLQDPSEQISPESRALAMRELAWLLRYKQGKYTESRYWYEKALEADAQGHPLHQELDRLTLTDLLSRDLNRPDEAEERLNQSHDRYKELPHIESFWHIQMAVARYMRGDLRGSLRSILAAEPLARRYGNIYAYSSLTTSAVKTLTQLGRFREANQLLDDALTQVLPIDDTRCRRAGLLQDRAALEILMWQSRPAGFVPPPHEDPAVPATEARRMLSEAACDMPEMGAAAVTDLAHSSVLAGQYELAAQLLTEAESMLTEKNAELAPRWADLQGKIALRRRDFAAARKIYEDLLQATERRPDADDSYWRALHGIAEAIERDHPEAALRYYRAAEQHLDIRSLEMPLGEGRGGYLGQHESGMRRYVELLVQLAESGDQPELRLAEALTAIRNARTRGVRTLTMLDRLFRLPGDVYRVYIETLERYAVQRQAYDILTHQELLAPRDQLPALARQKARILTTLKDLQESALHLLTQNRTDSASASLRMPLLVDDKGFGPPAVDEVLLTCHPGLKGWICLSASRNAIKHQRIADLTSVHGVSPAQLSQQILEPFSFQLAQARKLRVVAYGAMRQIDLHLLPFGKRLLQDALDVYYAFDLPVVGSGPESQPPAAPSARDAENKPPAVLLHMDPSHASPDGRRARDHIRALLSEHGYSILADPEVAHGAWTNQSAILSALARTDLFVFFGHVDAQPGGSWSHQLRIDGGSGLLLTDILSLRRAPRWVVLVGCETGLAAEELGGLEGLGPVQAFLASGSEWAIGAVRPVGPAIAATFTHEFFRGATDAGAQPLDPSEAMKAAQARMGTQSTTFGAPIDVDCDAAAFRIFRR